MASGVCLKNVLFRTLQGGVQCSQRGPQFSQSMFRGQALKRPCCPQPGWHLSHGDRWGHSVICPSTVWHSPAALEHRSPGLPGWNQTCRVVLEGCSFSLSHCYVSADCLHVAQRQITNNCTSYSFPLITRPELHISFYLLVPISQFTGRQRYGPGIQKFPVIIIPRLCHGTAGAHGGDILVSTFPDATKLLQGCVMMRLDHRCSNN